MLSLQRETKISVATSLQTSQPSPNPHLQISPFNVCIRLTLKMAKRS